MAAEPRSHLILYLYILATPHGIWDLSSLTRDVPPAVEALGLDHWSLNQWEVPPLIPP